MPPFRLENVSWMQHHTILDGNEQLNNENIAPVEF